MNKIKSKVTLEEEKARELKNKYYREWRRRNKNKWNAYLRAWRKAHPEKTKLYYKNYWLKKARQMEA
jgi:hypothetical protein